ncbi:MAG: FHA domain-containing protein [Verrucomicrobiota bacterium]
MDDEETRILNDNQDDTNRSTTRRSTREFTPNEDESATRPVPGPKPERTMPVPDPRGQESSQPSPVPADDDGHTRIYRPSGASSEPSEPTKPVPAPVPQTTPSTDAEVDPTVGWVVVVEGPGKGMSHELTYGMNRIGRNPQERIALVHGDSEVSRENHASITYDRKGRKFYVQHGGGQNLTYLGEQPLLQPTEVKGGDEIGLGQTVLKFVPLCGEGFDWSDDSAE